MIVDLVKPFVWPERPSEEDMTPWDHKLFVAVEKGHSKDVAQAEALGSWGPQKLRANAPQPRDRKQLRKMAGELLSGKQQWTPGPRGYVEVETDVTVAATSGEDAVRASAKVEAAQAETAERGEAEVEAVSKSAEESAREPVADTIKHGKRL